jgi:hypothetical protein
MDLNLIPLNHRLLLERCRLGGRSLAARLLESDLRMRLELFLVEIGEGEDEGGGD